MNSTRRGFLLAGVTATLAASAGCIQLEGYTGGRLTVLEVDSTPQKADTVEKSHSAVQSSPIIQQGIQRLESGSPVEIELSREEFQSVSSKLEQLPYYDRSRNVDDLPSGYYISLNGSVACLILQAYCSDIPGVEMERDGFNNCLTE